MTDFRMANIPKQEAYDLLRDWIKLVARHTNPDQDISELLGWLWKLKPATPDPTTGLVPCGCGNPAECREDYGNWFVMCTGCDMASGYHGDKQDAIDEWDTAMGWRADDET